MAENNILIISGKFLHWSAESEGYKEILPAFDLRNYSII